MERARNERFQKDYMDLKSELKVALESGSKPGLELSSVLARCEKLQEELNDSEKDCLRVRLDQRERELERLQEVTAKLAEVQQRLQYAESRGDNAVQELLKKQDCEKSEVNFGMRLEELDMQIEMRNDLQSSRKKCESLTQEIDQLRRELTLAQTSGKAALQRAVALESPSTKQDNRRKTVKFLLGRSDMPDPGTPVTDQMLQDWSVLKAELEDERDRCNILDQDLNKANRQLIEAREALARLQALGSGSGGVGGGVPAGETNRNMAAVSVGGHAISARASACLNPDEQGFWQKLTGVIHTQKVLWCASKPEQQELVYGYAPPRPQQESGAMSRVVISGAD